MRGLSRWVGGIAMLVVVVGTFPGEPAAGQVPDTFTNLKVFPKEIDRGEVVATMRGWAGALGVRCAHCHVGPDNLQGMDFATDEKATKRAAREMLKMVQAINGQYLTALPESAEARQAVSCYTCHRGQSHPPRSLGEVLTEVVRDEGLDAGLARYRTMRAEHYGGGAYDFSPGTLNGLAQELVEGGKVNDAIRVLRVNVEANPDSADAHAGLGFGLLQKGELEAAKASFDKALQLDPDNRVAQAGLQLLEPPPAKQEEP